MEQKVQLIFTEYTKSKLSEGWIDIGRVPSLGGNMFIQNAYRKGVKGILMYTNDIIITLSTS